MLEKIAIDNLMRHVANCDLPYKYFLTYDFELGDRYEHEQFIRDYVWNGIANRLNAKVRVWAVGLNPVEKRHHFHAVITSSKNLNEPCKLNGTINVPLLMVIDALFEQKFGYGRFKGDRIIGIDTAESSVIPSQNTRFLEEVPFGGYDRWRLQVQPYDVDKGGIGYIKHRHEVILWTGDNVINEFKPYKSKRRRYRRGKKKDNLQLT